MVSRTYCVFVVGWIQGDDTVQGGTGWGVELAKFFNRPVSVFDQARHGWFTWKDGHWAPDSPVDPGAAVRGHRHAQPHRRGSQGDRRAVRALVRSREVAAGDDGGSGRTMVALVALLAAAAMASGGPPPATGRLVEGLRCASDPSQTYTLYLPSGYSSARRWPALLVLDPRGRSAVAASLFREAAEAHGWILLSSNDTRSDGPAEPNVKALQALWPEVHERYAADPRRIYAAGFSGTGMVAWDLGRLTGRLAGVIASGSRWEDAHFGRRIAFPSFGAAGDADFNYAPMKAVHARLREWGTPERFELVEGPHTWMPAALAGDAIAWLELQAMKAGLRPTDQALVAARLAEDTRRAQALEAGRPPSRGASTRFEAIAATFDGLADVGEARKEAARLAGLPSTKAAREDGGALGPLRAGDASGASRRPTARSSPPIPPSPRARSGPRSELEELARHGAAPSYEGVVGRRLLATLAAQTGYYMAREFLGRGDHARAQTRSRRGDGGGSGAAGVLVQPRLRPGEARGAQARARRARAGGGRRVLGPRAHGARTATSLHCAERRGSRRSSAPRRLSGSGRPWSRWRPASPAGRRCAGGREVRAARGRGEAAPICHVWPRARSTGWVSRISAVGGARGLVDGHEHHRGRPVPSSTLA